MRKSATAMIVSLAALAGCGGSGKAKEMDPAEVVEAFCGALVGGEYGQALEYCISQDMQTYIDNIKTAYEEAAEHDTRAAEIAASVLKEAQIKIGDIEKNQDERLVNYAIVINDDLKKEKVASMKKEEGVWKISVITDRI